MVVSFSAPWCDVCVVELPELVDLQARHAGAGDLQIVSVIVDASTAATTEFVDRHGPTWPFVVDRTGEISRAYGRLTLPETFLVRPDGVIAARWLGAVTANEVDRALRRRSR